MQTPTLASILRNHKWQLIRVGLLFPRIRVRRRGGLRCIWRRRPRRKSRCLLLMCHCTCEIVEWNSPILNDDEALMTMLIITIIILHREIHSRLKIYKLPNMNPNVSCVCDDGRIVVEWLGMGICSAKLRTKESCFGWIFKVWSVL